MRQTFAALRHRNFRVWSAASFVSTIGTWMQVLGVNWYVLETTGSAAQMGAAVMAHALPVLLLGSLGGALADRLPGRPVLIITQIAHAVLAVALAMIAFSQSGGLVAVYVISLLAGTVSAIEGPVMGRFTSTVVDPASLGNALSLGSLVSSAGRILGMSVGGIMVVLAGPAPLFIGNAVSFLAVIGALFAIRTADLHPLAAAVRGRAGGVRAGFAYLIRQPVVLITLSLAVVLGSLGRNYQVTMAAMSDGPLGSGAAGYGLLSTVFAVGTVPGGFLAARRPDLGYRTLIGAGLLTSLLQVVAGFMPGLVTFALVIVPIAAGAIMIDTTVATRVQLDTRGDMRGRVLAALAMTSSVAGAAGAPLLGWLSEQFGPRETLLAAGLTTTVACVVAGIVLARHRGVPVHRSEVRQVLRATVGQPAKVRPAPAPTPGQLRGLDAEAGYVCAPVPHIMDRVFTRSMMWTRSTNTSSRSDGKHLLPVGRQGRRGNRPDRTPPETPVRSRALWLAARPRRTGGGRRTARR